MFASPLLWCRRHEESRSRCGGCRGIARRGNRLQPGAHPARVHGWREVTSHLARRSSTTTVPHVILVVATASSPLALSPRLISPRGLADSTKPRSSTRFRMERTQCQLGRIASRRMKLRGWRATSLTARATISGERAAVEPRLLVLLRRRMLMPGMCV